VNISESLPPVDEKKKATAKTSNPVDCLLFLKVLMGILAGVLLTSLLLNCLFSKF
jgi:hypothetical protein